MPVYIMTKFEGFDYESVLKKITALPEGILSAILKEYTLDRYDHSLKDPQTKQEKYLARYEIERIKKSTKTYIMTKFPDSTLEEVLKILSSLPGGVLNTILKEYSLKEGYNSFKEEITEDERALIAAEINKIKRKLNSKEEETTMFYRPFYSLFDGTKEEVNLILSTLTTDEKLLLYKRYDEDFSNIKYRNIPKSITTKIRSVIRNIKRRLEKYKTGEYYIKGLEDIFIGVKFSIISKKVASLSEKNKEFIYYNFGKDLKQKVLIHKSLYNDFLNKKALKSLYNKIYDIKPVYQDYKPFIERFYDIKHEDETDEELLNRVKNYFTYLTNEEKELLYLKYGKDLKSTENTGIINSDDDYKISMAIYKIKYYIKKKEKNLQCKPLIKRFENATFEEVLNEIMSLPLNEQLSLKKKYGEDFKGTTGFNKFDKKFNKEVSNICEKIQKRINKKKGLTSYEYAKCKPFLNRFDVLTTYGDILLEFEFLTDNEKATLQKKYGEDLLDYTYMHELDQQLNAKVKRIRDKMLEKINKRRESNTGIPLNTLKSILELTKTEEFEYLKNVIGINPALAVLTKKYLDSECSTLDISALTGVDTIYIIDVTKAYLLLEREYNRKLTSDETNLLKLRIGE